MIFLDRRYMALKVCAIRQKKNYSLIHSLIPINTLLHTHRHTHKYHLFKIFDKITNSEFILKRFNRFYIQ